LNRKDRGFAREPDQEALPLDQVRGMLLELH
jgi:hypothetical protein